MRKTTILGKVMGAVLAFAILFSMAVPAFAAASNHAKASFEIVSCEPYASVPNYMKVTYRVVMSCEDYACLRSAIVKVDGKSISANLFQKNAEGKYVYEGSAYKFNSATSTITMEVIDLKVQMSSGKQTETVYVKDVVNSYPKIYVSSIGKGLGLLGSTVISLNAMDDNGIQSISVNGKVVANQIKTEGKKTFSMIYDVYIDGFYSIVVTDLSGNKTNAYFTVEDGEITSQSAGSSPIVGDFNTYIPFYYYFGYSSLAEMMEENPMLYYYYLYQNYDGDISNLYPSLNYPSFDFPIIPGLPNVPNVPSVPNLPNFPSMNYPSVSLPNFGTGDNASYIWYLYLSGILESEEFDLNDPMTYYYLMLMLQGEEGDTTVSDYLSNMLIYKYIYGNAISFTDGNKIIVTAEGDTHKLTAPAIANDKNANYQWQKYVAGFGWINIAGATDKDYTLDSIVKGERYRVQISGRYYYSLLTSSTYTGGMTGVTEVKPSEPVVPETPVVPEKPADPEKTFTANDITIKGLTFPMFSIKVGQSVDLIPNCMGYWTINSDLVKSNANFGIIELTGEKAGTAIITYTGFDDNGNMAVKYLYVQVTE